MTKARRRRRHDDGVGVRACVRACARVSRQDRRVSLSRHNETTTTRQSLSVDPNLDRPIPVDDRRGRDTRTGPKKGAAAAVEFRAEVRAWYTVLSCHLTRRGVT